MLQQHPNGPTHLTEAPRQLRGPPDNRKGKTQLPRLERQPHTRDSNPERVIPARLHTTLTTIASMTPPTRLRTDPLMEDPSLHLPAACELLLLTLEHQVPPCTLHISAHTLTTLCIHLQPLFTANPHHTT
ncbi:Hypothetical predicted protein [Pelobates cultripes]|uniref:Uncharacterized protein n=1 Tax=Pelobates cultripes TaxID=61616 RepID=A0AAD1W6A4_PELCU|nr:Hypothetical predicted protein [Pelobates cultripes]